MICTLFTIPFKVSRQIGKSILYFLFVSLGLRGIFIQFVNRNFFSTTLEWKQTFQSGPNFNMRTSNTFFTRKSPHLFSVSHNKENLNWLVRNFYFFPRNLYSWAKTNNKQLIISKVEIFFLISKIKQKRQNAISL